MIVGLQYVAKINHKDPSRQMFAAINVIELHFNVGRCPFIFFVALLTDLGFTIVQNFDLGLLETE